MVGLDGAWLYYPGRGFFPSGRRGDDWNLQAMFIAASASRMTWPPARVAVSIIAASVLKRIGRHSKAMFR